MTSTIAKRRAVHRQLSQQQKRNAELECQAVQLESLANLGSAMAMIAHEINNLLTPPANYAELALQNLEDRVLVEQAMRKTAHNCRQAAKVMEGILVMVTAGGVEKVEVRLTELIYAVFDCLCRDFKKDSIIVEIKVGDDLRVRVVPVQLQQAMMNLILNAREAMLPRGGKLTIEAEDRPDDVVIKVRDTGCGIGPEEMKKVFDSFFSTKHKNGSSGSGLGLALCKRVVEYHNGSIAVDSQQGHGTIFTIILPKN